MSGGAQLRDERQLAWQLAAARLLASLLDQAAGKGLPVVVWEIGETGPELYGWCHARLPQDRRRTLGAWHGYLGATQPADRFEEQDIGNLTLLIAVWKRYQGVRVTLRAELDDDREEQW